LPEGKKSSSGKAIVVGKERSLERCNNSYSGWIPKGIVVPSMLTLNPSEAEPAGRMFVLAKLRGLIGLPLRRKKG
jgi:hypothetical protein